MCANKAILELTRSSNEFLQMFMLGQFNNNAPVGETGARWYTGLVVISHMVMNSVTNDVMNIPF